MARATVARGVLAHGMAALTCCALCACGAPERPAPKADPATSAAAASVDLRAVALRIHALVNAERAAFDLPALAWQPGLVGVATGHSLDMARQAYFSHNSPDGQNFLARYAAAGFRCRVPIDAQRFATGGENIAQTHLFAGYRVGPDGTRTPFGRRSVDAIAERVVQGWMNSPPHRDNILRPYWRSQAIGVAVDAAGRVFATENFC